MPSKLSAIDIPSEKYKRSMNSRGRERSEKCKPTKEAVQKLSTVALGRELVSFGKVLLLKFSDNFQDNDGDNGPLGR